MSPSVSFIVPVRNDAARLDACLQSIRRNEPLEIIVADNGSTDGSPDVAMRHGARLIVDPELRVSELRNRAAGHARGDVLAFVDADNEIVLGWSDAALDTLESEAVAAVGAPYQPPSDGTWVQRSYGCLRGNARGRQDVSWLGSGNLAVTRRTFEALGGFDTALHTCEDVDLCGRIRASGLRVVSDARMESVHHGDPRTLVELFMGELWRGRDNLRVSFRQPMSVAAIPSAVIPVIDIVMLCAAAAGLAGVLLAWQRGLLIFSFAILIVAAGAGLKAVRAILKERHPTVGAGQLFVVALVYDIGRALALVTRAHHRGTRPRALVAAP
jgi:hypothetical protein